MTNIVNIHATLMAYLGKNLTAIMKTSIYLINDTGTKNIGCPGTAGVSNALTCVFK